MYVAIVAGKNLPLDANGPAKDWSCFLGNTRNEAIDKAAAAKKKWDAEGHRNAPYRILVAQVYKEAIIPTTAYEIRPLPIPGSRPSWLPKLSEEEVF